MLFAEDLKSLFLYSNKRKMFIPINEKDKKHGSAIYLMSPSQEVNEKMMNPPFIHSPQNLYRSYYIDRNVMTYIDSGAKVEEEEFDEIQEAMLTEGMHHTNKIKFQFENASTMDEKYIKTIYNEEALKYYLNILSVKKLELEKIFVICHSNIPHLRGSAPFKAKNDFYSFTNKNEINILSKYVYDEKSMDGPYDNYLKHELIFCIITNTYPNCPTEVATTIAIALSGQVEYYREKTKKDHMQYKDTSKQKVAGLYTAEVIYDLYIDKGYLGLAKLLRGDTDILRRYATSRTINDIKKFFGEAAMTSGERNALKDSEFGLPDKRKFPLNDETHVRSAIRFFNHCDESDRPELARRIKSKMKKYGISYDIVGEKNALKQYLNESSEINIDAGNRDKIDEYLRMGYKKVPIRTSKIVKLVKESAVETDDKPWMEYADEGYGFAGNYDDDYYAVLQILSTFSKEEFDRVSFNSTYKNSPHIKKRIVLRDENNNPMSFMDIYHFESDPDRAQITTGVATPYRGHRLCGIMFEKLINSGWAIENNVKKYIWHVHPGNDRSENIAKGAGFVKGTDKLDKYGRMTYVYYIENEDTEFVPPMISESSIVLNECASFVINEEVDNSKHDTRIRKYLYKERLKNTREVMTIYDQIKARNQKIDKTYRAIKFYKGLNLYVDTSYYHNLYLKNVVSNRDSKTLTMYFDFLNRLMENAEVNSSYTKKTYFFSVHNRPGQTADDLMNWNISLNPISVIVYFAMKDADMLKRLKDKKIIFIGDNGYFTVDFGEFGHKNIAKFRRNITKLYSNTVIEDEDPDTTQEYKGTSMEVIDKVADHLKISDVSAISNIKISHLSMEDSVPNLTPKNTSNTAIMILSVDSNSVISEINSKNLKNKDIKVYYKPKI